VTGKNHFALKPTLDVSDIISSSIIRERTKVILTQQKLQEPRIKTFLLAISDGKGALVDPVGLSAMLRILPSEQECCLIQQRLTVCEKPYRGSSYENFLDRTLSDHTLVAKAQMLE